LRSIRIRAEVARTAIGAQATTVLPDPGGDARRKIRRAVAANGYLEEPDLEQR
jgi:hypothetical protein